MTSTELASQPSSDTDRLQRRDLLRGAALLVAGGADTAPAKPRTPAQKCFDLIKSLRGVWVGRNNTENDLITHRNLALLFQRQGDLSRARAYAVVKSLALRVMRPLMDLVDVVIANEEDIQSVLGSEVHGTDVTTGALNLGAYKATAAEVARTFDCSLIAITLRESHSASDNGWSAVIYDKATGDFQRSQHYDVRLVDRIGGGDSFAGGLIYGLVSGKSPIDALRFAVAASALKQTIPGDFNRVSVAEVERLVAGAASGRVQR